jgi:hypothetical protein
LFAELPPPHAVNNDRHNAAVIHGTIVLVLLSTRFIDSSPRIWLPNNNEGKPLPLGNFNYM